LGSVFWHNGARSTWFAKTADESLNGKALHLGLFKRKSNLGRLYPPVDFKITFSPDRTVSERANPIDNPDLAAGMTIKERMIPVLRTGALPREELAEEIGADAESVRWTIKRHSKIFTVIDGGKVAVLQKVS
jgi:hypothetical protein